MRRDISDTMLLLPYTPRADSEARNYSDWLKEVDNPFFNSVPGVIRYTNWMVRPQHVQAFPFRYFDFLVVKDPAAVEKVWSNEELLTFAANWTRTWGVDPGARDMSVNYHVYLCQRTGPALPATSRHAILTMGVDIPGRPSETWRVIDPILGKPYSETFKVAYVDGPAEALVECLAAPE